MRVGVERIVFVTAACLLWLTACETTSTKLTDLIGSGSPPPEAGAEPEATGSIGAPVVTAGPPTAAEPELTPRNFTPSDPNDELSLAKENFRQGNYGLAERYFRRAVEAGPKDAEAWLGLAASYDRLKRFDLADRAYDQLVKLTGPTPAVLNNIGYSHMLRGDYRRARETLLAAQAKDPANPYIQNNIALLKESVRTRKAVR
jgi:tetratricopeptide (TPR) repeat protein